MRVAAVAVVMLWAGASGSAQSLPSLAPRAPSLQHITVDAGSNPRDVSARGGSITLWVDVLPKPGVHVYAAGARDFSPVALVMTPRPGLTVLKPRFPVSEPFLTLGARTPVPVYRTRFRVTQPVTLGALPAGARETIVSGAVNYQACDDTTCYPPASMGVVWRLPVRAQ